MRQLKYIFLGCGLLLLQCATVMVKAQDKTKAKSMFSLSKKVLLDKIKGGWAGQTIGVTYGWPSEFIYQGTFIQDYEKIPWEDDYINRAMREFPGLYDDVYVDLTFLEVFDRLGLEAPIDSFAQAFIGKEYELWHANQVARYNLRNGVPPLEAGHWLHNPHADDIDFQIEADFAGLISPALPQAASSICERTGRMIASGDGYYGGVYVANMYALAFRHHDVARIVGEALTAIPKPSKFYQCITDVIAFHKRNPKDWKATWWEIQKKWSEDIGCPNGVFHPLSIDAKLNAAYVVMALLYGQGDFFKTMDIATRAGQDSDCNPATACGIIGTMKGYSQIPEPWLSSLKKAEDKPFSFTAYALHDIYEVNMKLALANIEKNGGTLHPEMVDIPLQHPVAVAYEENFAGHFPTDRVKVGKRYDDTFTFEFEGKGVVISGHLIKTDSQLPDQTAQAGLYIDGKLVETATLYTQANDRRPELFWRYQLTDTKHQVEVRLVTPRPEIQLYFGDYLIYREGPQTK
ncbi:ADP-ribosylglycohydrolase family protein [Sphingobacterium psychroaquaticum]|uniref:ADP-ribosylglycohydrolase n=1 Tax=Sphingobacterium psychroaquaticum TaxID=561061 RepID=A0A1X7I609_9SPHI|nr:ADP-ribosylglycohydrolase family protein [Sphingobacterium psychroaquaticum]SMG09686.1 ADP-ribosylglycohydrolase [Sphingobacterium psychroaquaticum]